MHIHIKKKKVHIYIHKNTKTIGAQSNKEKQQKSSDINEDFFFKSAHQLHVHKTTTQHHNSQYEYY